MSSINAPYFYQYSPTSQPKQRPPKLPEIPGNSSHFGTPLAQVQALKNNPLTSDTVLEKSNSSSSFYFTPTPVKEAKEGFSEGKENIGIDRFTFERSDSVKSVKPIFESLPNGKIHNVINSEPFLDFVTKDGDKSDRPLSNITNVHNNLVNEKKTKRNSSLSLVSSGNQSNLKIFSESTSLSETRLSMHASNSNLSQFERENSIKRVSVPVPLIASTSKLASSSASSSKPAPAPPILRNSQASINRMSALGGVNEAKMNNSTSILNSSISQQENSILTRAGSVSSAISSTPSAITSNSGNYSVVEGTMHSYIELIIPQPELTYSNSSLNAHSFSRQSYISTSSVLSKTSDLHGFGLESIESIPFYKRQRDIRGLSCISGISQMSSTSDVSSIRLTHLPSEYPYPPNSKLPARPLVIKEEEESFFTAISDTSDKASNINSNSNSNSIANSHNNIVIFDEAIKNDRWNPNLMREIIEPISIEEEQQIKKNKPLSPLPNLPGVFNVNVDIDPVKRSHQQTINSPYVSYENSPSTDSFTQLSPIEKQHFRQVNKICSKKLSFFLFIMCFLAPPMFLVLGMGWADKSVGRISKSWKTASFIMLSFMCIGAIVGIIIGLVEGVKGW
ncbi:hypothetical protein DAMA08_041770 [Martiniozyma asiatica (nom. inval.)]|nr:hypothetical protein DAMA08_041770 [Martiniozyma asiatica]